MERRVFLGVSAGATALASCGTFGGVGGAGVIDDPEVDALVRDLDRRMAAMATWKVPIPAGPAGSAGAESVRSAADFGRREELLRKGLRSLILVGALHDMPPEVQAHPAIQDRLWRAMPDMDESVLGMRAELLGLDPAQRAAIEAKLRGQPGLALEVTSPIAEEAHAIGTSWSGRGRLRALSANAAWRLEKQGLAPLIDELDEKVTRAARAHSVLGPMQSELRARLGEEAFWAHQERLAQLMPPGRTGGRQVAAADGHSERSDQGGSSWNDDSGGDWTVATIGGVTMGVAVLVGLIALGANSIGLVTLAGVLLLVGLIILILGILIASG